MQTTLALALALIAGLVLNVPAGVASNSDDPFYTTDELCKITLAPAGATNPVGGSQALTAKIESTGVWPPKYELAGEVAPVAPAVPCWQTYDSAVQAPAALNIDFAALTGPNAPASASHAVDAQLEASHTYSSQLAGTDVWQATAELPQVCLVDYFALEEFGWQGDVPPECEFVNRPELVCVDIVVDPCDPPPLPTVKITSNTSPIEWVAQVATQQSPSVKIASTNRCHTPNKFRIRPSAANGQVSSMTLYVDGKRVRKVNASVESFTIDASKYGPGSHSIKLVTTFTSGKTVTATRTFNRCKARAVAKRKQPRFTG